MKRMNVQSCRVAGFAAILTVAQAFCQVPHAFGSPLVEQQSTMPADSNALNPIGAALQALRLVATRTLSIASTYAAAHTVAGTGAAGSGLCVDYSITGGVVSCNSSDFRAHLPPPPPTGNDVAFAHADAFSGTLGLWGAYANTNKNVQVGDAAYAYAYAKGGAKFSLALNAMEGGVEKDDFELDLGQLTLTSAAHNGDPGFGGTSVYRLSISDLDVDQLDSQVVPDIQEPGLISAGFPLGLPSTRYFYLEITFDSLTGNYSVINTSNFLSSGSLLTAADFTVGMYPDEDQFGNPLMLPGIRLNSASAGSFTLAGLPVDGPGEFSVSLDEAQEGFAVGTPEPATLALMAAGAVGAVYRRRSTKLA